MPEHLTPQYLGDKICRDAYEYQLGLISASTLLARITDDITAYGNQCRDAEREALLSSVDAEKAGK